MSAPERDRTHWHGCYTEHHECAVREVERLREALEKLAQHAKDTPRAYFGGPEPEWIISIARRALNPGGEE